MEIAQSIASIITEHHNAIATSNSNYHNTLHRRVTTAHNAHSKAQQESYNKQLLEERIASVAQVFTPRLSVKREATDTEKTKYEIAYNAVISGVFHPPGPIVKNATVHCVDTPANHIAKCGVKNNGTYAQLVHKIITSATKKHIPIQDAIKLLDTTYRPVAKKIDKLDIVNNKNDAHTFYKLYENIIDILFAGKKPTLNTNTVTAVNSNGHGIKIPSAITRLRNVF